MKKLTDFSPKQIRATRNLLQWFRDFLASDCDEAIDPYTGGWFPKRLNKAQARKKLHWLIDVAINRRAGLPDNDPADLIPYWRDKQRLEDILVRRIRHYQFETVEVRNRFGHLLSAHADD